MTGEITLRGKVLPVGGIKEKILAAARFGLKTVILPKHNEADLDDVPQTVRDQMTFILVDTVDEVLAAALDEPVANPDGAGSRYRAKWRQVSATPGDGSQSQLNRAYHLPGSLRLPGRSLIGGRHLHALCMRQVSELSRFFAAECRSNCMRLLQVAYNLVY